MANQLPEGTDRGYSGGGELMNITTPCHGVPLLVLTAYSGGYMGRDEPDEIVCMAEGCHNSWNADGTEVK